MMESLQLPILVIALVVMSWAVIRLGLGAKPAASQLEVPSQVLRWQADLKRLSVELQAELDEKMAAVTALSQAYEQASQRLSSLIDEAEQAAEELESNEQLRRSA